MPVSFVRSLTFSLPFCVVGEAVYRAFLCPFRPGYRAVLRFFFPRLLLTAFPMALIFSLLFVCFEGESSFVRTPPDVFQLDLIYLPLFPVRTCLAIGRAPVNRCLDLFSILAFSFWTKFAYFPFPPFLVSTEQVPSFSLPFQGCNRQLKVHHPPPSSCGLCLIFSYSDAAAVNPLLSGRLRGQAFSSSASCYVLFFHFPLFGKRRAVV